MKSENVLLTICLFVIAIFMLGLCMVGCNTSSKIRSKTKVHIDSTSSFISTKDTQHVSMIDSLSININEIDCIIENYLPIKDNAGVTTGSVLINKKTIKRHQYVSKSTQDKKAMGAVSSTTRYNRFNQDTKNEIKQDKHNSSSIVFCFFIFCFIGFLVFKPPLLKKTLNYIRVFFKV